MASRRAIASLVLVTLVLVPVVGLAADDFSAPPRSVSHESGLRHPPPRPWRTIPAAVEPRVDIPLIVALTTLDASEPSRALPPVVRTPFVPPRG